MSDLLDVNVWLALADENHSHHAAAQRYWQNQAAPTVAFCRVTMLGFLRLATHPNVLSRPLSPSEAWDTYQRYLGEEDVSFVEETPALEKELQTRVCQPGFHPRLWTDAYLAALARCTSCRVVSFDSDFKGLLPDLDFLLLTS
jgi:toxin-antitoxin system PIN domain toxin